MATQIIKNATLPAILPHGWKKEIAKVLGVHQNTITNNLRKGSGCFYDRIVKAATEKYGKKQQSTKK